MRRTTPATFALLLTLFVAATSFAEPSSEEIELFEKRVRPILAANCYSCHGVNKQESNFRLDSRQAILTGGDNGPAAIPGQVDASPLVLAVRQSGDLKMPPEGRLRDDEIASLERWIDGGLVWPETKDPSVDPAQEAVLKHWAFQPVHRPSVPAITADGWDQQPIDQFIRKRTVDAQLEPSPALDRGTLIRRLSFDLLGIPPDPNQVSSFVEDQSPDAVERLIDRLLAAPQYGERWGRHWLDVARYADNKGYVFFEEKSYPWAYTYRDYVIRAFNEDIPFDRFVIEQLAADQLDLGEDKRALTALGFLTIGGHFMNNTHDIVDDRIDVVTRGLMGLTVTCARCHDHKYDPIPQADYYSLYGVFRSCFEPTVPPMFETPPQTKEYENFAVEMEKRQKALIDFVTQKHSDLVTGARTRAGEYMLAAHAFFGQPPIDDFMLLVDKGDLNPAMLLRWRVYLEDPVRQDDPVWSIWSSLASLSESEFSTAAPQRLQSVCSSTASINPLVRESFATPPVSKKEMCDRYSQLLNRIDQRWQQALKQAAIEGLEPPTGLADPAEEELRRVFYGPDAPPDVPIAMDWGFLSLFPDRPTQGEYQKLLTELESWMMNGTGAPPRAMVLQDSPRPFDARIFLRGNPHRLGQQVPRQFLAIAGSNRKPFVHGSGRLELAQAIVAAENPLTSRVIVNRVWMNHFGSGLVRTPGDFGLRSEPPSHAELLDWLAAELMNLPEERTSQIDDDSTGGTLTIEPIRRPYAAAWSLKQLHRQILTSATYQQSAHLIAESVAKDPATRLNKPSLHPLRRAWDYGQTLVGAKS